MTMTLIETKTLGTAAASIEFTSIAASFTDLVIYYSARTTASGGGGYQTYISFNSSTSGYSWRSLFGDGSAAQSQSSASDNQGMRIGMSSDSSNTANTFGNSLIYIPNYAGSTNKSISTDGVSENNASTAVQLIGAGLWANTAAITTVKLFPESTTFVSGSTFSLYGILKGSDGIVTTS